jgi:hypothetical protein
MRSHYINSKVLFIADVAIHDDSRYDYIWTFEQTKTNKEILTGYKIYYTFKELGVKEILLSVIDKVTKLQSDYSIKVCIIQNKFINADKINKGLNGDGFNFDMYIQYDLG